MLYDSECIEKMYSADNECNVCSEIAGKTHLGVIATMANFL